MKKSNIKWFKGNKNQIKWAEKYITDPERQARLKVISEYKPVYDYSTFSGVINLFKFLDGQVSGKDFIDRMANAWSKFNSNKYDDRDTIQSKLAKQSHDNLKFLAKELKLNKSEVIEYLIEKEIVIEKEEYDKYKIKVDRVKKKYEDKKAKDALRYGTKENVPLALHNEVKKELEKTKEALRKVINIIESIPL